MPCKGESTSSPGVLLCDPRLAVLTGRVGWALFRRWDLSEALREERHLAFWTPGRRESLPSEPDSSFTVFWNVPPGSWPPFSVFCGLLKWWEGCRDPISPGGLLQASGPRHRDLLRPTINVYVLWKPGSAYLKVKGCFHIICWIIDKSRVPNQVKGKHCLRVFADRISHHHCLAPASCTAPEKKAF